MEEQQRDLTFHFEAQLKIAQAVPPYTSLCLPISPYISRSHNPTLYPNPNPNLNPNPNPNPNQEGGGADDLAGGEVELPAAPPQRGGKAKGKRRQS